MTFKVEKSPYRCFDESWVFACFEIGIVNKTDSCCMKTNPSIFLIYLKIYDSQKITSWCKRKGGSKLLCISTGLGFKKLPNISRSLRLE